MAILRNLIVMALIMKSLAVTAQINLLKNVSNKVQKSISNTKLSEQDVKQALIEALNEGSVFSVNKASAKNGFNKNIEIRIPIPTEANKMKETLIKVGFKEKVEDFEISINRAAEVASKEALDILAKAIKNITINDAFNILDGNDDAATNFLREETNYFLYQSFKPIIITAMKEVKVANKWEVITKRYNSIPLTKKINPDLEDYITNKAIDGLFILIAYQEKEIRNNPLARTSDILKKVFNN